VTGRRLFLLMRIPRVLPERCGPRPVFWSMREVDLLCCGRVYLASRPSAHLRFRRREDNWINVPRGTTVPGGVSTTVSVNGNLPASLTGPIAQNIRTSSAFESGGAAAVSGTALNGLDTNAVTYVFGDQILISGNDHDKTPVAATFMVAAGSTRGNLLSAIDGALTQSTATLDATGRIELLSGTTRPSQLILILRPTRAVQALFRIILLTSPLERMPIYLLGPSRCSTSADFLTQLTTSSRSRPTTLGICRRW